MASQYDLPYTGPQVETLLAKISELESEMPSKTSDLTNDSGFITSENVPTKTSDLNNDSGFITNAPVAAEAARAQAAEALLATISSLQAEISRATGVEGTLQNLIDGIAAKIPSAATEQNQLADKSYVNASIATASATFRGTYISLVALQSVAADENDYGYVISTDSVGNTIYNRYKYANSTWTFEYAIANPVFDSSQWAAINSAVTAELVAKLSALPDNATLTAALAAKQDVIDDLSSIRSKANSAYQKPSGGIPASDIADGVIPDIADNLTTNDATKALSAKQGKVLNENLTQLGQDVDDEIRNIHSLLQTVETPKSVTGVKPSSTGVYITGDSSNYASYYIPVLKGQIVYYSATNSAKKPISCCFSSAVPAIDGTLTDYVAVNETSVAWKFVAPYDGYFVVYHYKTYFTNQEFDSVLSITQRTDSTPINNSKNFVSSGGLFTEFHKSDVISKEGRVTNIRPYETGFFVEAGSNSVFCWYIPVLEGDVVHYRATDHGSRTLITCFCSEIPANGVAITDWNQTMVSNVNRYIIAPYSGFFVVYHHINYFTDQGFTIRSPYSTFFSGKLELEGGQIGTNGRPACETTSRLAYMSSFRTPLYIRASKLIYISGILQGETVKIYCYDSGLRYLGVYTNVNNLSPGTYYVKIAVSQESEYTGGKTISLYGANNDGEFSQVYNSAGTDTQAISFEVGAKIDMVDDYSSGSATVDMSNERHFDNGVIRLPYNYQFQGEPVKLAIFWHGTGGQDFRSPGMQYSNQMEHLQRNGYLVADCSGMTDKYQLGDDAVASHDCRFNPLAVSCFCALYDYVVRNYNVRKDGCYVFGKSNGGLGATYLGITRPFPIKAVASLAGSLSIVESMRYSSCSNLNYWCARFGMTGYTFSYSDLSYYYANQTPEGNAFIIGGADKYKKWDPFILLTGMDESTLAETMFENGYMDTQQTDLWAMVNANAKVQSTPMKIWHAVDDNSVPIYISRMYKALVERMNGICFLREIPAGYGGHHAVDNANNAPTVIVNTKYDGAHTTVATYEELVEWFNRW